MRLEVEYKKNKQHLNVCINEIVIDWKKLFHHLPLWRKKNNTSFHEISIHCIYSNKSWLKLFLLWSQAQMYNWTRLYHFTSFHLHFIRWIKNKVVWHWRLTWLLTICIIAQSANYTIRVYEENFVLKFNDWLN